MLLISEAHEELFQLLIQWHDSVRGRLVYSFLKFSLRHSRYKGSLAVCHGSLHQPGEDASTVTCYIYGVTALLLMTAIKTDRRCLSPRQQWHSFTNGRFCLTGQNPFEKIYYTWLSRRRQAGWGEQFGVRNIRRASFDDGALSSVVRRQTR